MLVQKAQVDLKLKTAVWGRTEVDLKHKIKLLQDELNRINTKENLNRSRTSVILEQILSPNRPSSEEKVKNEKEEIWKQKEFQWKCREDELSSLLEETRDKLKTALDNSDDTFNNSCKEKLGTMSPSTENRVSFLIKSKQKLWSLKESSYKQDLERASEAIEKWKRRCADIEKLKKGLENSVLICQAEQRSAENECEQEVNKLKQEISDLNKNILELNDRISTEVVLREKLVNDSEEKLQAAILIEKVSTLI